MTKLNIAWYDVLDRVIGANELNRVLLYGPPDTGKSTSAIKVAEKLQKPCYRCQCARQQGIEDLLGSFILQDGATRFVPGPVPRAMAEGAVLLLDEFDKRNPSHDSIYHALLDDSSIASVRLPDGSEVKPKEGFTVIATTNESPESFSPALLRRFELKLWCGVAHPGALASLPKEIKSLLTNWQKGNTEPAMKFELNVSSFKVCVKLARGGFTIDESASLVFGKAASAEIVSALANNQQA